MACGGLGVEVTLGRLFRKHLQKYPKEDKLKIFKFVRHVEQYGLTNLEGRNKSSADIPKNDPLFASKLERVNKYNLWHYHIGIIHYEGSNYGDKVSEYVLHYMRFDNAIKIVDMDDHHPIFRLPTDDYLD